MAYLWRGNSYLENEEGVIVLRKGLPKFFDLKPLYLDNLNEQTMYEKDKTLQITQS